MYIVLAHCAMSRIILKLSRRDIQELNFIHTSFIAVISNSKALSKYAPVEVVNTEMTSQKILFVNVHSALKFLKKSAIYILRRKVFLFHYMSYINLKTPFKTVYNLGFAYILALFLKFLPTVGFLMMMLIMF